jgi:hypothetical protein
MVDRNLIVFLAIRELQEEVNAHRKIIHDMDELFRTMHADNSLLGRAARKLLYSYVKKNLPPSIKGMRLVDIPPVNPGTYEVSDADGSPSKTSRRKSNHHVGGTDTVSSNGSKSLHPSTGD